MRVLIIDDQPVNTRLLATILSRAGFESLEAGLGNDGIELARSKHPDLVLLDIGLPDMSGLVVAMLLKADANTRAIPIIVVSAYTSKVDRDRAKRAGCDGFIPKPVDRLELLTKIDSFVRRPNEPGGWPVA
jgi:CheY-like chemotaxis protein